MYGSLRGHCWCDFGVAWEHLSFWPLQRPSRAWSSKGPLVDICFAVASQPTPSPHTQPTAQRTPQSTSQPMPSLHPNPHPANSPSPRPGPRPVHTLTHTAAASVHLRGPVERDKILKHSQNWASIKILVILLIECNHILETFFKIGPPPRFWSCC